MESIRNREGIVLVISENLDILSLTTHMMVLDKGRCIAFGKALDVVDSYVEVVKGEGTNVKVPSVLRPAIARRQAKGKGKQE